MIFSNTDELYPSLLSLISTPLDAKSDYFVALSDYLKKKYGGTIDAANMQSVIGSFKNYLFKAKLFQKNQEDIKKIEDELNALEAKKTSVLNEMEALNKVEQGKLNLRSNAITACKNSENKDGKISELKENRNLDIKKYLTELVLLEKTMEEHYSKLEELEEQTKVLNDGIKQNKTEEFEEKKNLISAQSLFLKEAECLSNQKTIMFDGLTNNDKEEFKKIVEEKSNTNNKDTKNASLEENNNINFLLINAEISVENNYYKAIKELVSLIKSNPNPKITNYQIVKDKLEIQERFLLHAREYVNSANKILNSEMKADEYNETVNIIKSDYNYINEMLNSITKALNGTLTKQEYNQMNNKSLAKYKEFKQYVFGDNNGSIDRLWRNRIFNINESFKKIDVEKLPDNVVNKQNTLSSELAASKVVTSTNIPVVNSNESTKEDKNDESIKEVVNESKNEVQKLYQEQTEKLMKDLSQNKSFNDNMFIKVAPKNNSVDNKIIESMGTGESEAALENVSPVTVNDTKNISNFNSNILSEQTIDVINNNSISKLGELLPVKEATGDIELKSDTINQNSESTNENKKNDVELKSDTFKKIRDMFLNESTEENKNEEITKSR